MGQYPSPRRRHVLLAAAAASTTLFCGAGMPVPAAAASPAAASPAPAAVVTSQRPVTLINGDRLLAGAMPGGGFAHELLAGNAKGVNAQLVTLAQGGRTFVIPADALPYLGRGLSPSLFDMTSLLRDQTGGRLPVEVHYAGRMPSLPGVRVISAGGRTARGFLTAASAQTFGAALARQFTADHTRGSYGQDGLFAGDVSVSLPGTASPHAAARPAEPHFPMETLTATATNLAGKPDTGDQVLVFNADDSRKFIDPGQIINTGVFDHGVTKFSVPAGNYWAVGLFQSSGGRGRRGGQRIVVLPQFTVHTSSTVHLDERAARQIQIVTPRPTHPLYTYVTLVRFGRSGPPVGVTLGDPSPQPVWLAPTSRRPTVGALQALTASQLDSPPGAPGTPYEYGLAYLDPSGLIPARQRHVVHAATLAHVHARYYQAVAAPVQRFSAVGTTIADKLTGFSGYGVIFRAPSQINEYFSPGRALVWFDQYFQQAAYINETGGQSNPGKTFTPGERVTENWGGFPLHPAADASLIGARTPLQMPVSASRSGDQLGLYVTPFSDNQVGDTGSGYTPIPHVKVTGRYEIDENGKKIASGDPARHSRFVTPDAFGTVVQVSPKPSVIRLLLTAARQGSAYPLSPASRTVWTWRSAHEAGHKVPVPWQCLAGTAARPRLTAFCAAEPMMTLRYSVAGMALNGSTPAGRQVLHVTAGHIQLANTPAVTSAAVSVSFNGGKTWHHARVTGHDGSYTATFTAPAGAKVSLRARAADAAGGSVTETLTNAYQTSA